MTCSNLKLCTYVNVWFYLCLLSLKKMMIPFVFIFIVSTDNFTSSKSICNITLYGQSSTRFPTFFADLPNSISWYMEKYDLKLKIFWDTKKIVFQQKLFYIKSETLLHLVKLGIFFFTSIYIINSETLCWLGRNQFMGESWVYPCCLLAVILLAVIPLLYLQLVYKINFF